MYKVVFTKNAKKQLAKIADVYLIRIEEKLNDLAKNPFDLPNVKKLEGFKTLYRLRISDLRIIYDVNTKLILIEIIEIVKRNDVYKKR